jgi:GH24 family phage-related lysozyme (muramidase)
MYPPTIARHDAPTDDGATVVIVIRIVVVIGVGSNAKSDERTTVKPAMKSTGEAAMEAAAVEAAAVKSTTVKSAAVKSTTVKSASAAVKSASATVAATTTGERNRRLNQTDRCQCDQSHHHFARHACLHARELAHVG